jgi:TolB-like protein/DNA-binding winged helix-turn-helix (wHTH) protein/tetratricopeptide (TPR) repeat protein
VVIRFPRFHKSGVEVHDNLLSVEVLDLLENPPRRAGKEVYNFAIPVPFPQRTKTIRHGPQKSSKRLSKFLKRAENVPMSGVVNQLYEFEEFRLDAQKRVLLRGKEPIPLTPKAFEVLLLLVQNSGQLLTKDNIMEAVWPGSFVEESNLTQTVFVLRKALGETKSGQRYILTLPGQGYRFIVPVVIAPVAQVGTASASRNDVSPQAVPLQVTVAEDDHGPSETRPHRFLVMSCILAGTAVLALVAITNVMTRSRAGDAARSKITSLAVLPLKNLSGDQSQDYLADGMTESLVGRLSGIRNLRVTSRTSVMRFKDTQLSVPEIAKTLLVDAIVEGSVIREGNRIRVHAQLIRCATDEHFWSETYDRELRDVLSLESEVAQSIAAKVEVTVTGKEHKRLTAVRVVSPEVYESYLKGRFALEKSNTRAQTEQSIGYFDEAIKRDPAFAPAYVGLAAANTDLGLVFIGARPEETRPKVMSAARKALELDPDLAEAHVLLANVLQEQWHWAEAEAEYRRALELNPNDADAHARFALWLLSQGRTDEALATVRRGRELDPLAVSGTSIAWILFQSHRYDEAIHELGTILAVRPDDASALWYLGFALIAKGQPEKAIPALEKAASVSDRSPGILGVLVRAYAHAGRRSDALRILAELKTRNQAGYVPAAAFVHAYLGLGENEQAFAWLERAYEEHSNILLFVKVHPYFDPLRGDPRFVELVRRVGLDKS